MITLLIIIEVVTLQLKVASLNVRNREDMHMLHSKTEAGAFVVICLLKKKGTQNVEYHATMLLMNIVVEQRVKPVGLCLEMSLKVSSKKLLMVSQFSSRNDGGLNSQPGFDHLSNF